MYVFDCGYLDYERFDRMTDEGFFFFSRLRKNVIVRPIERFQLLGNSLVQSEDMVVIGTAQNRTENTFHLLKVFDSKGHQLNLLTNLVGRLNRYSNG